MCICIYIVHILCTYYRAYMYNVHVHCVILFYAYLCIFVYTYTYTYKTETHIIIPLILFIHIIEYYCNMVFISVCVRKCVHNDF